ncbi:MAG: ribonuclease P protein component [Candidatus Binatia bacterium]
MSSGRAGRGQACSSANALRSRRLPKQLRIRGRGDFLALQRHGKPRHTPHFVVLSAIRRAGGPSRVGITVSRKVGNAVARNRVKRRVREFFRLHRDELPAGRDFVFIAKSGAEKLSYADVVDELRKAIGL